MDLTIVLHGKYSGMIRLVHDGKSLRTFQRGIPPESRIFIVSGDSPYLAEPNFRGAVHGILVTDSGYRVIMEGRARLAGGNNETAKAKLSFMQSNEKSAALTEILERAQSLFSPIADDNAAAAEHTDEKKQKRQNTYNPFSSTYPNSSWKKVFHKNDRAYHIVGVANVAGEKLSITAVPINFYSESYFMSNGFVKIIRADDGTVCRMKVKRI